MLLINFFYPNDSSDLVDKPSSSSMNRARSLLNQLILNYADEVSIKTSNSEATFDEICSKLLYKNVLTT